MEDTIMAITMKHVREAIENGRADMVLDLKYRALKENRMDIFDWLESKRTELLAKKLKEL